MQKFETAQQIFDYVYNALKKQGRRSVRSNPDTAACLYRAPNGDKCAAGHLITDEHYTAALEGLPVNYLDVSMALMASGVPFDRLKLVDDLQLAHDVNENEFDNTLRRLRDVAVKHGLQVPTQLTTSPENY
jgi:hypothetical protein